MCHILLKRKKKYLSFLDHYCYIILQRASSFLAHKNFLLTKQYIARMEGSLHEVCEFATALLEILISCQYVHYLLNDYMGALVLIS